nr:unnamed protein product [Callosobruchus chinensis]
MQSKEGQFDSLVTRP